MMSANVEVLRALDLEKDGDWDGAHRIVQKLSSTAAMRVHAYLHRREGDLGNARYWYSRCGAEVFAGSLDEEWQALHGERD